MNNKESWNNVDEYRIKATMSEWPNQKAPETLKHRLLLLMQAPKYRLWHLALALIFMIAFPPVFSRLTHKMAPGLSQTWMLWVYVGSGLIAFFLMGMLVVQYMYELEIGRKYLPKMADQQLRRFRH